MISYFPSAYQDELLYSQLARFYIKSGYLAYRFAAEDLFINKTTRPDIEFVNAYRPEALELITRNESFERVIQKHTMFGYYGRFIKPERRKQAFQSLVSMGEEYHNLLSIPKRKDRVSRYLRYCPLCVNADRKTFGETYWHRVHQMTGVNICPIHHCNLIDTDLATSSNVSPALIAAEEVVSIPREIVFSTNSLECRLAEYIAEVFQSDVHVDSEVTTGQFMHSRMENTKYLSQRGRQRNMAVLHTDFLKYYAQLPNNQFLQQWQIQKVFSNDRYNTNEVCMLAMFLGIPANDLVNMKLPTTAQHQLFDEQIRKLHDDGLNYQQIATRLNASYNVVKAIGEGLYGSYHYFSESPRKGGAKRYDWDKIDAERLPIVKATIENLSGYNTQRPVKITIGLIERYMNLPKNGLRHCPECRKEILSHYETQEEYWARELVWAVNEILSSGQALHRTQVKKLTQMRNQNIDACLPYVHIYGSQEIVTTIMNTLGRVGPAENFV